MPPAQTFLALFTATPTPSGGGTEVGSGSGYGRQVITFTAPASGQCSNTADIVFPIAVVADWGTITSYGIYDAASGGNLLYFANLSTPRYVAVSDQLKFPAGQLIANET